MKYEYTVCMYSYMSMHMHLSMSTSLVYVYVYGYLWSRGWFWYQAVVLFSKQTLFEFSAWIFLPGEDSYFSRVQLLALVLGPNSTWMHLYLYGYYILTTNTKSTITYHPRMMIFKDLIMVPSWPAWQSWMLAREPIWHGGTMLRKNNSGRLLKSLGQRRWIKANNRCVFTTVSRCLKSEPPWHLCCKATDGDEWKYLYQVLDDISCRILSRQCRQKSTH